MPDGITMGCWPKSCFIIGKHLTDKGEDMYNITARQIRRRIYKSWPMSVSYNAMQQLVPYRALLSGYFSQHFAYANDFNWYQIYYYSHKRIELHYPNLVQRKKDCYSRSLIYIYYNKNLVTFKPQTFISIKCVFVERMGRLKPDRHSRKARGRFLFFFTAFPWNMVDGKLIQIGRSCNSKIIQQLPVYRYRRASG